MRAFAGILAMHDLACFPNKLEKMRLHTCFDGMHIDASDIRPASPRNNGKYLKHLACSRMKYDDCKIFFAAKRKFSKISREYTRFLNFHVSLGLWNPFDRNPQLYQH